MNNFRPHKIQVSSKVFYALQASSATRGIDCADALADALLSKLLSEDPEVQFRQSAFTDAMKEIDARAKAEFAVKVNDAETVEQLP